MHFKKTFIIDLEIPYFISLKQGLIHSVIKTYTKKKSKIIFIIF